MVLVFDLDDTLYPELTYVHSGFRGVAQYLQQVKAIPPNESLAWMLERLSRGRGRIFDDLLSHYGQYSQSLVRQCIAVYRNHWPEISLDPEADRCLDRFAVFPKYIVTDGHKGVQQRKVQALGLERRIKFCFITHRYGVKNAKPSPYCFLKICQREKVQPQEVVYIGDNPRKDFVGIKPLGFKTIRVMQGQHQSVEQPESYEAEYRIAGLEKLTLELLEAIGRVKKGKC